MEQKYKTALITGGTKGIGFGIAAALIADGLNVAITGRNQVTVDKAVKELTAARPGAAIGIKADVREFSAQENAISQVVQKWGRLDVLIANAGLGHFAPVDQLTVDQWKVTIDTNLTGVFYSIKTAFQELKKSKGYLITISSLAGTNFFAGGSAYNASKFGLTGFTQAVMLDLRQYDIKVTTIMPGSVATDFNSPHKGEDWKIQIEDIGQMVADLLKMHPRTLPSKIEVRPSVPK